MVGAVVAVAIVYYLAARLGLVLLSEPSDVAVFWPASGIAVGILIISGRRAYPALVIGVMIGTVAANIMSDRSFSTAVFKGFCNAGEAVLAAWLLERWFARPFRFANLRRVVGFLAAAVLATAASATGGAATMTLLHAAAPYWDVWCAWLLSDWVGIVVVAPLVIGLSEIWREPPSLREWTEGLGVLTLSALVSYYTVGHESGSWVSFSPGVLVLPLLLWLTARCPTAFGTAGAFIASAAVILATTFGVGRFGDAAVPLMARVRGAQAATTTVTLYTLVLIALFAQRKEAEEELRESEGQLAKKSAALARLHEVGSRLWRTRDLRQALSEILAGAIELLGADMGTIRILDTQKGVLRVEAHRGFTQRVLDFFDEVPVAGDTLCGRALRAGERMVVTDVEADPLFTAFRPLARAAGYRAMQSTPITNRDGMPLGMLATHFRSAHKPTEQDLRLLDLYVRQAAEIIERHKAEAALRESEERLRLAQLRTGIGVWDWDLRTDKVSWTPELETLFGLEPGTVKRYADFRHRVHPEDIAAVEARREAALRCREAYTVEYRIIRPDGQIRWITATGGALYDEATGEPTRILGNNADITERKQAELALAERNAQLALAGRAALVSNHAYDADLERMTVSEGYAAIHGLPEGTTESTRSKTRLSDALAAGQVVAFGWDAITGRSQRSDNAENILGSEQGGIALSRNDFIKRVHPDDRASLKTHIRELDPDDASYALSFRYVRPDGRQVWLEETGKGEFNAAGRLLRIKGLTRDITERKIAELALAERNVQLALAATAGLVGSYSYDTDTDRLQVSEGYAAIHGLPERTKVSTRTAWQSRALPEDRNRINALRIQAFRERRGEYGAEYRIVRAGEVRWIESRSFISYSSDGSPQRVIGVNIDVTERKRAEERQGVLVAELDHRVKNVLATVSAIITQTQEACGSHAEFVTALNRRINSLARTHELLSESNWRGASLAEIVRREFAPYATGNAEARGPSVTLKAEATQAVATVLHELTTNAAKYGAFSNRKGRVSVKWRWLQNGSHDRLLIEWQETGGPPVIAPSRSGYGTSIIRELIPFELGGEVELSFAPDGTKCRLEISGEWTSKETQKAEESRVSDSA
jgi:PAS domain S-box-containing protein